MSESTNSIIDELIKQDPEESSTAYAAFLFWSALTIAERSNDKEALQKTANHVGRTPATMHQYKINHRWDERAKLIEAHFFKSQFNNRMKAMESQNLEFANENRKLQMDALRVGRKALSAAENLLDTLALSNNVVETDYVQAKQSDGTFKTVPTTTQIIMKAETKDIAPLIRAAIETPIKVMGLPTEVITPEVVKNVGEISTMSDDDIAQQLEFVAKEKEKLKLQTQNLPGVQ